MATPVKFPAFDLTTPEGRRRAEHDLVWTDHGFLRAMFQNFHWVEPGVMARSNQPSPQHLERYAKLGFKTILNFRGKSDTGYYELEKDACERLGMALIDLRLRSREPPSQEAIHRC
jgi:protein tyrosine/serine phosphatase